MLLRTSFLIIGAAVLWLLAAAPTHAQKADMDDADRVVRTVIISDTTESSASNTSSVVRPGAPGESGRAYDASSDRGMPAHTEADIAFMQDMILHHAQALEMTAMVEERTTDAQLRRLAQRIELAQADEIAQMVQWLEQREAEVPPLPPVVTDDTHDADMHGDHNSGHQSHDEHTDDQMHDHSEMAGMLSPDQLQQLADAEGETFERLFLEFMIYHHEGAVTMVEELYGSEKGGQESTVDLFASHVESAQDTEIRRMQRMLVVYE